MPISTNMLILARYVWRREDHHFYICRHYRATVVIGVVTQNMVAASLGARDMGAISPLMAGPMVVVGAFTHTIRPFGFAETGSVIYNFPNTPYSPNPLPSQVACLVRLKLLIPAPRRIGRIYLPSPPEEALTPDAKVSATYRSAVASALVPLTQQRMVGAGLNRATLTPVVWHRPGSLATRVVSLEVLDRWATQIRRGSIKTPTPFPFRSID